MEIRKILIANRGEIALRIMRTCQKLGIQTVAVYSEADQDALFVREADQAALIGAPPVQQSYLNKQAILEAARETEADAIHPGYGLLSEQAAFAEESIANGFIWIGPQPEIIAWMGDKAIARAKMEQAGVPLVPGSPALRSLEEALSYAEEIGYPVLLKASAGGGGMGMYSCLTAEDLEKQFPTARDRARILFGNDSLFLEKYLSSARHVEVQIAGDRHGNIVHLGERDCSVQRRHQKVVEESPAPNLSQEVREKLWQTAVKAAEAVGYESVGTVEFILAPEETFYFLEMNTRLQVEHTVTESITGTDLVEWQIALAEGKKLPLSQEEISFEGHAMEFRICAEDPVTFYPSPGKITEWTTPHGKNHRLDSGVAVGSSVTPFYDSLLAKWIVSGSNRAEVLQHAREMLGEWKVEGVKTNLPLFEKLFSQEEFLTGKYDTKIIERI